MTCCGAQNLRSQRSPFTQQESSQLVFFFACSSCAFVPFSGVCALWTALTGTGTYRPLLKHTELYWLVLKHTASDYDLANCARKSEVT